MIPHPKHRAFLTSIPAQGRLSPLAPGSLTSPALQMPSHPPSLHPLLLSAAGRSVGCRTNTQEPREGLPGHLTAPPHTPPASAFRSSTHRTVQESLGVLTPQQLTRLPAFHPVLFSLPTSCSSVLRLPFSCMEGSAHPQLCHPYPAASHHNGHLSASCKGRSLEMKMLAAFNPPPCTPSTWQQQQSSAQHS